MCICTCLPADLNSLPKVPTFKVREEPQGLRWTLKTDRDRQDQRQTSDFYNNIHTIQIKSHLGKLTVFLCCCADLLSSRSKTTWLMMWSGYRKRCTSSNTFCLIETQRSKHSPWGWSVFCIVMLNQIERTASEQTHVAQMTTFILNGERVLKVPHKTSASTEWKQDDTKVRE